MEKLEIVSKRRISVFTSDGKFSVFTLSFVNTALNQSSFRIYKCYIIMKYKQYKSSIVETSREVMIIVTDYNFMIMKRNSLQVDCYHGLLICKVILAQYDQVVALVSY